MFELIIEYYFFHNDPIIINIYSYNFEKVTNIFETIFPPRFSRG